MVELKKNSWHRKLNAFVYGEGYFVTRVIDWKATPPVYISHESQKNLCPYFWGTVLAFWLLPFAIFGKSVIYIINHIPKPEYKSERKFKMPHINMSYRTRERLGTIAVIGLLSLPVLGAIFGLIYETSTTLIILAYFGGLIGFIFLLRLIRDLYERYREKHPKIKKPSLVREMIGAWYHRKCPRLEWK